jgi:hypothetical protein
MKNGDPRLLSEETLDGLRATRTQMGAWGGAWAKEADSLLDHIAALTEERDWLREALRDNTEWIMWRPSRDGIGQWAERTCGLCRARTTEDSPLVHEPTCALAGEGEGC